MAGGAALSALELRAAVIYPALALLLAALLLVSLRLGPVDLDLGAALAARWSGRASLDALILFDIRLPRSGLAILVGATLGLAGAALQGLLRNPLAEPGIIGVSNGAALGAVLVFYFGLSPLAWFVLPAGGMAGALCAVLLVLALAGRGRSSITLILAGIAVNAVGGALIALALNLAASPYAMQEIVFWLLGSVANRSAAELWVALPFMLVGWLAILASGRFLNALTLGEDSAISLGFDLARQRLLLVLGITLSVGAAVSVSGNIGFIGLVVPHLVRPLVGYEPRRLLPASLLTGAIALLLADIAVQLVPTRSDLQLGVVTALVGAPFFLFLILRSRSLAA